MVTPISKTRIRVPNGVTTITQDSCAQNKCTSIGPYDSGATFELPNTITTLVTYCFGAMPNLKWVELPDSVTKIDTVYPFAGCSNLKSVYIPNSLTTVPVVNQTGDNAGYVSLFYAAPKTVNVYSSFTSKPNSWSQYWNATSGNGGNRIPNSQIHWNISRDTYRTNYRNN